VDAAALGLVQAALDGGTTDNVTVVVAEAVPTELADDPQTSAAAAVGPMLVGAAAAQPRRGGALGRALFRHRQSDTGELEPVAAEPVDPEEVRYAPRPPRRRLALRRTLLVLLPLLVVVGAAGAAYAWSQNQYYVAEDGSQVAIYKGVQMDLPGIDLSHPYRTASLRVSDLSPFNQQQVADGIVAHSLQDAQRILDDLTAQSTDCPPRTVGPSATPAPTPTRSPSAGPTRRASGPATATQRPRGTRTAAPSRSPGPTPSPSAGPTGGAPGADCADGAAR
jgi:PPM family protein phosphatase